MKLEIFLSHYKPGNVLYVQALERTTGSKRVAAEIIKKLESEEFIEKKTYYVCANCFCDFIVDEECEICGGPALKKERYVVKKELSCWNQC